MAGTPMNKWQRILKHRWYDDADARRMLGAEGLAALQARVAASEQRHSGEIRICIEAGLPMSYLWRGATPRERALSVFGKLRVWDTEANNGVLIYLLLAERAIEIVADRGLARLVDDAQWQTLMATMAQAFRDGRFGEGLNQAVDAVDAVLQRHFPLAPGQVNPNELSDAPHWR
jgi:uncharacterized membrane protein YgcG